MKNKIIWNHTENRPRFFWRLLGQLLILVFTLMILDGTIAPLLSEISTYGAYLSETVVGVSAFIISAWLAGRWMDHRSLADFGFHLSARWWRQLGFGILLGAGLMTAVFLIELALGYVTIAEVGYTVQPDQPLLIALLIPFMGYMTVAISEEVLFRGYYLRNTAEMLGVRLSPIFSLLLAIILSSIVFGIVHASNPAATTISTIYLMLLGVLFAFGYLYTGELAIPIGLHLTWNFFQGNVYGFPVSGWPITGGSLLRIDQSGPEWITGGGFGPEAGVLGVGAMVLGCILIAVYARWRGEGGWNSNLARYTSCVHPKSSETAPVGACCKTPIGATRSERKN